METGGGEEYNQNGQTKIGQVSCTNVSVQRKRRIVYRRTRNGVSVCLRGEKKLTCRKKSVTAHNGYIVLRLPSGRICYIIMYIFP